MKNNTFTMQPIGFVKSSFTSLSDCPFQGDKSCPPARVFVDPAFSKGLEGLMAQQDILIITMLDKASRNTLRCRPRNNPNNPLRGVFATRSPNRPNPIGLHQVKIKDIEGRSLTVHPLEVLDNTPVLDIKPVLRPDRDTHELHEYFSRAELDCFLESARQAWTKGLLNGLNGNLSIRKQGVFLITGAGSAKGLLSLDDLCLVDIGSGEKISGKGKPSSESGMHREIYRNQPEAKAVAHTHPISVLTLEGLTGNSILNSVDLFEARAIKSQLASVPDHEPGSMELAAAAGARAREYRCILMRAHGLTCWGKNIIEAVALCDELEALARIEFNTRCLGRI